jgi:cell division protein FtsW (lipid II flippase)
VPLVIEMVAYVVIAVLTWLGMHSAIETVLYKAQVWTGLPVRTPAELAEGTRSAYLMFVGGMAALALARFTSIKRGRGNIDVPLLVPAACAAAALGLCLQIGYANPLHLQFWPGPEFARGFLIAAALGAFIILLPRDPVDVFTPVTPILPVLMIGTFVALRLWGHGTEAAPDTLINLGPIQPLELVKLAFVIYLAIYFGRRASKLRFQRDRVLGLDFPRKKVLFPAMGVMLLLFGAFVFV